MNLENFWNILLIDDDEDEFFLISSMAEDIKDRLVRISWVNSLAKGHVALKNNSYDAILVDYDLRGSTTGLDFIQEVRLSNRSIPLVLYTGCLDQSLSYHALVVGASSYLNKASVNAEILEQVLYCLIEQD